jgi:type I restriction-modification system DNA methylase subunit
MDAYTLNKDIETLLRKKDAAREGYSPEEIAFIQQYEGAGGKGSKGATGEGVLYEFYTPVYICQLMWKLAWRYGFDPDGTVLEPSLATGRFLADAPRKDLCYGFEINPVTRRIAEITYPDAHIYDGYFETAFLESPRFANLRTTSLTWLEGFPFSLVIGNPPYGKYRNRYSAYFPKPKMHQIELFFMYYGLQMLKKNGLLLYLVSSNFMRNGLSYQGEKQAIESIAELVDAYRLPPVFRSSQVPVDILVFRKTKS